MFEKMTREIKGMKNDEYKDKKQLRDELESKL